MTTRAPLRDDIIDRGRAEPPSPPDGKRGGGGRGWVELLWAADDIEAHLLAGRLEEAGVETSTMIDRGYPGAFLYGGHNPWAPVAILVRKIQLDEARVVLAELAYEGPDAHRHEEVPRRKRFWALKWWIAAIGLALAFTALGLAASMERCERAGLCKESGTRP